MGEHEGWPQPNGLLPNGLLSNESASVIRVLDEERWSKAEDRTAELIACIQPNQPSEEQRNAVADYVQRLIMRCFPCQVFAFGSVPLKTYLPDGDIDLTAFSKNQTLKDTWASLVRDMLESEEKNESAEFHVKEVQYIQAEVKIIKCLVENIVVDISFNQLGGLCTLCFLEEVDHLINQNHLFKRSIILIKAWCYYESRILGAHHGLISTYALETLVLYIFHVFNNSFSGPLEVLYRFLEFFSIFDWDNFCVSLWGPVSVNSLPDVTAVPPRKDGGELLLSKLFLDACSAVYAVFPGGQENQGQPFVTKHFNVIDPLRVNNNLGRSVNKGNYYRIRSAFAFGAKRLARILDCPKENIVYELNQFFMNTWERHGSGIRPDAPSNDLRQLRPSDQDHVLNNQRNDSGSNKKNEKASIHEIEVDPPAISRAMDQKPEHKVNEFPGRYLFARTRSSPELTDTYRDASFQTRRNKPAVESRRKNVSETVSTQSNASSSDDILSGGPSISSVYVDEPGNDPVSEDRVSVMGAQGMHQEEQDLINLMASSSLHSFGGHVSMPFNLGSTQLPLPISQSILTSMGYPQRTVPGMVPTNIPLIDPYWAGNLQFHQGMMSSPFAQYFPGVGLPTNPEDFGGREQDGALNGGLGYDDDDDDERQPSTSANSGLILGSRIASPVGPVESQRSITENRVETFPQQDNLINEVYDRVSSARFSSASQSGSVRSKTSSESSRDGSSGKVAKDKHGRKITRPALGKGKNILEHSTTEPDDEERDRDWNITSATGSEIEERRVSSQSASSGSDSMIPIAPMVVGPPASCQKAMDNSGVVPFTFYPTGPPVPFLTMLPVTVPESSEEIKSDILHSDFASHWQNLQFGRLCQGPRFPAPVICPSPVSVPPMYLQGRFPWDGPGRPLGANVNLFPHLMNYGPRLVPVAPLQSVSNRPAAVYQQYVDELPRHRSGTGTYLPNPASLRDRHSSGTRRNSFNYDRTDHADREGNWNTAKARAAARSHNRNQTDKSRIDRPWIRHEPLSSYQAQNGPIHHIPSQNNSTTQMAYGMYQFPGMMNTSGLTSSNGENGPSVVMLYPYDHNSGYVSPNEQLEFGSLGPFVGMNQRLHGSSTQQSSPDQPSSPHFQRSVAQMNYRLKDEDFPPLAVSENQGGDDGTIYNEKHSHHQTTLVFASQA